MKDHRSERDRQEADRNKGLDSGLGAGNMKMQHGEKDALDNLGDRLNRAGRDADRSLDRAGDKAERLGDRAQDSLRRTGDSIERGVDRLKDKAGDAMHRAGDKLERGGERLRDDADRGSRHDV